MIQIPNRPNPLYWEEAKAEWAHLRNIGSGEQYYAGFETFYSPSLNIIAYDLYGPLHRSEPVELEDTDWRPYTLSRTIGRLTTLERHLLHSVVPARTYEISWPCNEDGAMVHPRELDFKVGLYIRG